MNYEEWKEKASKEKTEISVTDLIDVCSRIASVVAEPKSKVVRMLKASIETVKIIDEFFPEKKEEEPDAEKPAEKTELSALEELLFERTHLRDVQYHTTHSALSLRGYAVLGSLVRDAGLKEKYNFWKAANGYE